MVNDFMLSKNIRIVSSFDPADDGPQIEEVGRWYQINLCICAPDGVSPNQIKSALKAVIENGPEDTDNPCFNQMREPLVVRITRLTKRRVRLWEDASGDEGMPGERTGIAVDVADGEPLGYAYTPPKNTKRKPPPPPSGDD